MTKKQIEATRTKITDEFYVRNTKNREAAIAKLQQAGVIGLFEDVDVFTRNLREMLGYVCSGCPDGVPSMDDLLVGYLKRVLTATTWLAYEAYAIREDITDKEIAAAGAFRKDDDYLGQFRNHPALCSPLKEKTRMYKNQRKILDLLNNYILAMASYCKDLGAVDVSKMWLDALPDLLKIEHFLAHVWMPPVELAEEIFATLDAAQRATLREWTFARLTPLKELSAVLEKNGQIGTKKAQTGTKKAEV